jgi:hypothetical protein
LCDMEISLCSPIAVPLHSLFAFCWQLFIHLTTKKPFLACN